MLPGVELARRRRANSFSLSRASHSFLPSSRFQERGSHSIPSHEHHSRHQHNESDSHPRYPHHVGSRSRRTQGVPHGRQPQFFQEEGGNTPGSSSSGRNDAPLRDPSHRARLSVILQGHIENNLQGPALEARERLDERLRSAALVNHRHADTSLPRLAEHFFNAVFSDDDEQHPGDQGEWEMSMREWLAGQAPRLRDPWQSEWAFGTGLSGNPIRGMSKAEVDALPREVFQQAREKHVEFIEVSRQVECSICLEMFLAGQNLLCLPCNHRFHPHCVAPWLEGHAQCPYCRAKVSSNEEDSKFSNPIRNSSELQQTDLVSWLSAFRNRYSQTEL